MLLDRFRGQSEDTSNVLCQPLFVPNLHDKAIDLLLLDLLARLAMTLLGWMANLRSLCLLSNTQGARLTNLFMASFDSVETTRAFLFEPEKLCFDDVWEVGRQEFRENERRQVLRELWCRIRR
jgi:hypothetical protein